MVNVNEIIGFDLGHGQTSMARVGMGSETSPEVLMLFGQRNQITAIAQTADGRTVIGEAAMEERSVSELEVAFKRRPDADPTLRKVMKTYVKIIHDHLRETSQIGQAGPFHYFVGCPSGWKDGTEIPAYEALLRESGVTQLTVVRESHAALVYAKETRLLSADRVGGPIMVIDIGSSTTDFTFSADRRSESLSDGCDLGGGLLDRALMDELLGRQDNRAEIEGQMNQNRVVLNKCLLRCRQAKEKYFSEPERYRTATYEVIVRLQRGVFVIEVDAATMGRVLARPLAELGGRTWEQAFRDAAAKAKRDWVDSRAIKTGVVVATGGASMMPFIKTICEDTFRGWVFTRGSEPEHAISRGLSMYGRVVVRTQGFDADVQPVITDRVPKIVQDALPALLESLADKYADAITDKVIVKGMNDWRGGTPKALNDLDKHMTGLAESWAKGESATNILTDAANKWLGPVQNQVTEAGRAVCERYLLPPSLLQVKGVTYKPNTKSPELPGIGDPTSISDIVGNVVVVVTLAIIAITLISVTVTGPIGAAAVAAAWVLGISVEAWAKSADLPLWIRRQVLSTETITGTAKDNRPALRSAIRAALDKDTKFTGQFSDNIIAALRAGIRERIDEARLLIK